MLYVNPIAERFYSQWEHGLGTEARSKVAFQELEHYFLYMLMKEMRRTVPENSLFGRSSAMDMYEDLRDDALSRQMAESGQFGLAKLLEAQYRAEQLQREVRGPAG